MSGRENGYVGPDRRLRAPIMGITHTQLALKRLNCLENEGEGREVSLTKRMVGWISMSRYKTIIKQYIRIP